MAVEFDLGTLVASDYNALDVKCLRSKPDSYLKNCTRDNVQLLIKQIWELPVEGTVAELPKPECVLPRSRACPKPKPLTKWQQFAKEKGISTKKNKSKLKWDEELGKWIPTYGYKRAKAEEQKEWLVDNTDQADAAANDPFAKLKLAKQERRSKNELKRLRNVANSKNIKLPRVGLPNTKYPNSQHLSQAVTVARLSTASVGLFQPKLPKEKDARGIAEEMPGMKRKRKAAALNRIDEKRRSKELVDNILKDTKILREDYLTGNAEIKQSATTNRKAAKKRKTGALKQSKSAKKPKAGKGKRNLHAKVGGRKRR